MRNFLLTASLAGLVLMVPAHAAVLIDNFDTTQNLQVGPGGINPQTTGSNVATGTNAVGGFRYAEVSRTGGAGVTRMNVNSPVASVLGFGNDESSDGTLTLIWDGNNNSVLDHGMGVDLTEGGNNTFIRIGSRSDLIVGVTLFFYTGAGNYSEASFNTPGGGTALPFTITNIPFLNFAVAGGTGADFSSITGIMMALSGPPSFDAQFDIMEATGEPVPEPATYALVGLALLGVATVRRRVA